MKYLIRLILLAGTVAVFSCKSARKIQTAINKKDTAQTVVIDNSHADSVKFINSLLNRLKKNTISDFNSFSAKIKVNYRDKDGEQPELTVNVRMKKDSIIWLSINATIFSYEAFRVIITPDSVKLLNKRDKIAQFRSVNYLQEITKLPFTFSTLQDLILGNPIYLDSNVVSYRKENQFVMLMNIGELFKNLVTISGDNCLLLHSKLDDIDPIRSRTCDLTYSAYDSRTGPNFATHRVISLSEKSKLDVDMDFKQYSFNETLSYPFSVPRNYKRR